MTFTWIQDADSDCIETTVGDRRLILPILTDCTVFHKECGLYDWYAGCLIDHLKESYAFTGDLDQSARNVFEAEDRAAEKGPESATGQPAEHKRIRKNGRAAEKEKGQKTGKKRS